MITWNETTNLLTIDMNTPINKDGFEAKILKDNTIDKVFSGSKLNIVSDTIIQYDTTGFIPLLKYVEKNPLTEQNIKEIIYEIDNVLNTTENYLLSENSFLLRADTIFVDTKALQDKVLTHRLTFVMIPQFKKGDFEQEINRAILFFLRSTGKKDKDAILLAYNLFSEAAKDGFIFSKLLKVVGKRKETPEKKLKQSTSFLQYIAPDPIKDNSGDKIYKILCKGIKSDSYFEDGVTTEIDDFGLVSIGKDLIFKTPAADENCALEIARANAIEKLNEEHGYDIVSIDEFVLINPDEEATEREAMNKIEDSGLSEIDQNSTKDYHLECLDESGSYRVYLGENDTEVDDHKLATAFTKEEAEEKKAELEQKGEDYWDVARS